MTKPDLISNGIDKLMDNYIFLFFNLVMNSFTFVLSGIMGNTISMIAGAVVGLYILVLILNKLMRCEKC